MTLNFLVNYIRGSQNNISQEDVAKIFSDFLEKYLSIQGHGIDDVTYYGNTLLMQAAKFDKKEIVKVLLKRNARLDQMVFLCAMNKIAVLECLLEELNKVSEEYRQNFLNTFLLEILKYFPNNENKPTIEWLLEKGAELNCTNQFGETPLMLAVKGRALNLVTLLLDKADVDAKDNCGMTSLMHAVSGNSENIEIVKLLLGAKASIEIENRFGQTPLIIAVTERSNNIVKLLLDDAQEPIFKNAPSGYTPLFYAVTKRKMTIINTLIQYGAPFDFLTRKLEIGTQKQLLTFATEASRMVLPTRLAFEPGLIYSHNRKMVAYAQEVGAQVALKTPLPADVSHIINRFLFRDGALRTNSRLEWHQKAPTVFSQLPADRRPKTKAPAPKRHCRR